MEVNSGITPIMLKLPGNKALEFLTELLNLSEIPSNSFVSYHINNIPNKLLKAKNVVPQGGGVFSHLLYNVYI